MVWFVYSMFIYNFVTHRSVLFVAQSGHNMSRCYYPVWIKHKVQYCLVLDQKNKLIGFKISDIADRLRGRDEHYAVQFFDPNAAQLDPDVLSDIFDEDVITYTERVTNHRTVLENYCELRAQEYLQEVVQIISEPDTDMSYAICPDHDAGSEATNYRQDVVQAMSSVVKKVALLKFPAKK